MPELTELRLLTNEIEELVELLEVAAANLCPECEREGKEVEECPLARWIRRLGEERRFRREYEVPCL